MKDYLFRGYSKGCERWIYGNLIRRDNRYFILETLFDDWDDVYEVVPETVGMYIQRACYNPNEIKIFEGDIIKITRTHKRVDGVEESPVIAIVVDEHSITENGLGRWFPQDTLCVIEVIGNVHDNPELVGEKEANLYKYYFCLEVSTK